MAGNSFGTLFRVTSFGESHGPALGCIVDGCPPGLALSEADIQVEMDRRKPGTSRFTTQRREPDEVRILSGVFEGKTTGTPIGLMVENKDQKPQDYSNIKNVFRPGHGDYTYQQKYGIRDYRGGGRASARETAMRVAAGAIAKKYLKETCGTEIKAYLAQMGHLKINQVDMTQISKNPFFCPDPDLVPELEKLIIELQRTGDSIGALICVRAEHVPVGLGEPVFNRLDADIAHAMMSINAVKGVEIGAGFKAVSQKGSEHRDEMTSSGFLSNEAGGILAGISTGQTITANIALKPASSIRKPGKTIDIQGKATEVSTTGRHDPCVGVRAAPIAEAMLACVLMDHLLRHRAQNLHVNTITPNITEQDS